MDDSLRAHPGCVNAANAYHECGASCLERIAKGEKRKDKKKSDNHSGIQIKKKDYERRVNQSCVRASNPYHECDELCSKRTTLADALGAKNETVISTCPKSSNAYHECDEFCSKRYGRKRDVFIKNKDAGKMMNPNCKRSSNPYHECDGNCLNKNTEANSHLFKKDSGSKILEASSQSFDKKNKGSDSEKISPRVHDKGLADPKSPRSHFSLRQAELENAESFSSEQYSEGIYSRDQSFDKEFLQSVPASGEITPDSETEKVGSYQNPEGGNDVTKYSTFRFSGAAGALDQINEEEIQSVISGPCVSIGKYRVRANFSSTLQAILERYGDIAANCHLESASLRAYYLEGLCSVVQELHSTVFQQLTKAKVKEMFAVLKDLESANIDVTWLRGMLNEISEAIEFINQRHAIEATISSRDLSLESTWKKLESSWST